MSPSSTDHSRRGGFTLMELMIAMSLLAVLSTAVISAYLFMGRNLERLAKNEQQDVKARRAIFQFAQDIGSATSFTTTSTSNVTVTIPTTLALANCALVSGNATVTCTSTTGLAAGMSLITTSGGIPANATVSSVTSSTKFVMSAPATAAGTALAVQAIVPITSATKVSYDYSSAAGTLTRKVNGVATPTQPLLTEIDASLSSPPNNLFNYYNSSGTTAATAASVSAVEFAFTTKAGNPKIGTASSYAIVSPRVVARNKQFLP